MFASPQGTISKKILKDFKFDHLSTGDVLRKHVREATPLGVEAKGFMEVGFPCALDGKLCDAVLCSGWLNPGRCFGSR